MLDSRKDGGWENRGWMARAKRRGVRDDYLERTEQRGKEKFEKLWNDRLGKERGMVAMCRQGGWVDQAMFEPENTNFGQI